DPRRRQPRPAELGLGQPVGLGGGEIALVGGDQFRGPRLQPIGGRDQPRVLGGGRHRRQDAARGPGLAAEPRTVLDEVTHGDGMPPRNGSRPGSGASGTSQNGDAGGGSWASEKSGGNCTRTGSSAYSTCVTSRSAWNAGRVKSTYAAIAGSSVTGGPITLSG